MKLLVILTIFLNSYLLYAQFILSDWKAYTSYSNTNNATVDLDGKLWVSTDGGVFKFDPITQETLSLNNLNGLSSVNATCIEADDVSSSIYVGYEEGYIDIITSDGRIINVLDIASSGFNSARINDLLKLNGRLFIAGNFGLTELLPNLDGSFLDQIFGDTFRNISINKILSHDGKIWISSDQGIAHIDENSVISDPNNWTFLDDNGLPALYFKDLSIENDSIYVIEGNRVYNSSIQDLQFSSFINEEYEINSFVNIEDQLFYSFEYGVRNIQTGLVENFWESRSNSAFEFEGNTLFLTSTLGVVYREDDEIKSINPPSPASNQIADLKIDKNGNLWVATSNAGFFEFNDGIWTTYNGGFNSELEIPINSYRTLSVGNNNEIYAGHFGNGVVELIKNEDELITNVFDNNNSPLFGVDPGTGNFVVVGETEMDPDGTLWMVNWADLFPGPVLVAKREDEFYAYEYSNPAQRDYFNIAIDNNGTIWMGSEEGRNSNGLLLFNNGGTFDDESDDKFLQIRESSSSRLVNNVVNAIEVDKNGWVWCGTPTGVTYFITPDLFRFYDDVQQLSPISPSIFDDLSVNDILIDPINQKWFATQSGVWIYDEDGVELIARISSENSPLPEDNITAITINENTGEVFFGTNRGIFSAKSLSVKARDEYQITVYPQPFNPEKQEALVIDGLGESSDVKIITSNGQIVFDTKTQSRRITWNGRDNSGNKVGTGVYLIIATSETSDASGVGKIAIVRKP